MTKYVVGFLIDTNFNVVLIRKNKPRFQADKLNGPGGKIEEGETPAEAMKREFAEEAGVIFEGWKLFTKMTDDSMDQNDNYELYVFKGFVEDVREIAVKSMTEELIEIHNIKQLFDEQILPSAMWLITMALDNGTNGLNLSCF